MKTLVKGLSVFHQHFTPGLLQGSALQLGGSVILNQSGSIRYDFHRSDAGKDVSVEEKQVHWYKVLANKVFQPSPPCPKEP